MAPTNQNSYGGFDVIFSILHGMFVQVTKINRISVPTRTIWTFNFEIVPDDDIYFVNSYWECVTSCLQGIRCIGSFYSIMLQRCRPVALPFCCSMSMHKWTFCNHADLLCHVNRNPICVPWIRHSVPTISDHCSNAIVTSKGSRRGHRHLTASAHFFHSK